MIRKDADLSALLSLGIEFWTKEKAARLAKERIWQECWLAYDSKFGQSWNELQNYRSRRYLALPWLAVENVVAKDVQSLIGAPDWLQLAGRTPIHDNSARFMQALMSWQFGKMRFPQKFSMAMKQAEIFGSVPYQVKWDHHTVPVPDEQGFQQSLDEAGTQLQMGEDVPMQMPDMPTKELLIYDGPDFEVGNIFDFVIERSPKASYERAMRASRFIKGKAYLLEVSQPDQFGQQLYEGIEDLQEQNNNQENSDSLKFQVEAQIGFNMQDQREGIELIEIWGDFDIPGGEYYKNHVLTIANRSKVVRFEPNPFYHGQYPWQLFTLNPEPGEPYGRGCLEPALGTNDIIQVRTNQVIDANTLTINPMFTYVENGITDPAMLISAPGTAIPIRQNGDIAPIGMPDKAALAFNEIGFMESHLNQITGAASLVGQQGGGPASATQATIESQMATARDSRKFQHISEELLQRALGMWYRLNQQFMDQQVAIRVAGDPLIQGIADPATGMALDPSQPAFINVSPDDIAGDFDIVIKGAQDIANNTQQAGQLLQLFGMLMQSPMAPYVKPFEFFGEIFKKFGIKDAWRFVKTQQEVMLEQQQQMAMQAAAGGPGANGGPQGGPQGSPQSPGGGGPASAPGVQESRPPQPGGSSEGQRSGPRMA